MLENAAVNHNAREKIVLPWFGLIWFASGFRGNGRRYETLFAPKNFRAAYLICKWYNENTQRDNSCENHGHTMEFHSKMGAKHSNVCVAVWSVCVCMRE